MTGNTERVMLGDVDFIKVLSAWGANTGLFAAVASWFENLDGIFRLLLVMAQVGVALATIVYIVAKTRKLREKKDFKKHV